jgi:hypothetical protein
MLLTSSKQGTTVLAKDVATQTVRVDSGKKLTSIQIF